MSSGRKGLKRNHASDDRAREDKRAKKVEILEIDGVASNISLKLMEAILATKQYFKIHSEDVIDPDIGKINIDQRDDGDIVSSIIDRVEHAKEAASRKKEATKKEGMLHALQSWIDTLEQSDSADKSSSTGCLRYVWELQKHERPSVRRMSLYVCGRLLLTDEACMQRWKDSVLDWLNSIIDVRPAQKYSEEMVIWQKECAAWVAKMESHYNNINSFRVARMFLEQKGPPLQMSGGISQRNMADWRRIRDIALSHGVEQCELVTKLVDRAYVYVDRLIPRIGTDTPSEELMKSDSDSELDDDDNIDWEEGDEELASEAHAAAVEHTLTLMKTTGSLRGGDMEISFKPRESEGTKNEGGATKKRLQKLAEALANRYLPCFSTWVNALNVADNLVPQNGSLVALSSEKLQKRKVLLERLLELKRAVASVLSSASRLEIKTGTIQNSTKGQGRGRTPGSNVPRRHLSLTQSMERRHPTKSVLAKTRSNAIQIKLRKT